MVKPFFQGKLDTFCAIYAVLNALRLTHGIRVLKARDILNETLLALAGAPEAFRAVLEQKTDYSIGKYGIMRGEYMIRYQRHEYLKMLMDGIWNQYLHDVDEECHREVELAVKRIMEKESVTEQLKSENPMEWVQRVNGIKARVEEVMQKM